MRYTLDSMLPERAFIKEGGQIKPQGGGSNTPTSTSTNTTSIPSYAQPYVENTLGQTAALTDINQNPYQPYTGQQVAGFSPLQNQAMAGIAAQGVAPQLGQATDFANTAGRGGIEAYNTSGGLQTQALGFGQQGADLGVQGGAQYGSQGAGYGAAGAGLGVMGGLGYGLQGAGYGANAAGMAGMGYGAGAQYANQATDPNAVSAYMSPYMQNAVDVQKQEANRGYDISQQQIQGNAVTSGAFGGSRDALMRSENERNRNTALNQIQAQGSQAAYDKAMQSMQYGSGLGIQGLQAGTAAQQAGIQGAQAGMQGVNTALAGTSQGMQGSQVGLSGVDRQLAGNVQGLQGVQGAVGAGQYGLAGLGTTNQSASTLGQLGQAQFGQEQAIQQAQMQAGLMQQLNEQQKLNVPYQQYQESLNYPYKQLGFMSDMFRGLPLSQSSQVGYQAAPPMSQQLMGMGLGAAGMYKAFS